MSQYDCAGGFEELPNNSEEEELKGDAEQAARKVLHDVEFQYEVDRLAHQMQTAIALDQGRGSNDGTAKHLRVGVNMAMVEFSALLRLLIDKGCITMEEFEPFYLRELRTEVERYRALLGLPDNVVLE